MKVLEMTDLEIYPGTEEFLSLFPHRFDYIWSNHGIQPQWRTESRHPLHNSLIDQAANLYGVRFGKDTRYAMIDIDSGSPYHPRTDPLAIDRMVAALEPLGIIAACKVSSSYSKGLHLYFPLAGDFPSWKIATAIDALLTAAGFQICKGWLEIFPNARTSPDQLYAAHRLPMQAGSYVLNEDYEPIGHTHDRFVSTWRWAEQRNTVTERTLNHVLKFYKRRNYTITARGAKFLQDLDAEIERGWTGHGQTNVILGRIAMRGRCFGHILEGTDALTLRQLIKYIVRTAIALPGYTDWCKHQGELEKKAEHWARSAMAKYWPYGIGKDDSAAGENGTEDLRSSNPWNQLQRELARDRIRYAVYDMLDQGTLPDGVLERVNAIASYGVGGHTLYQHTDLWHPNQVSNERINSERRASGVPEALKGGLESSITTSNPTIGGTSLLPEKGGDHNTGQHLKRSDQRIRPEEGGDHSPIKRFTTDT
jgi:hypothetical protein